MKPANMQDRNVNYTTDLEWFDDVLIKRVEGFGFTHTEKVSNVVVLEQNSISIFEKTLVIRKIAPWIAEGDNPIINLLDAPSAENENQIMLNSQDPIPLQLKVLSHLVDEDLSGS
jgi:hypothetical protein